MVNKSKTAVVGAFGVGLLALAVVGGTSTAANADPIQTPNYAAVGSDTIQDLYDAFGNGYVNAGPVASTNGTPIASYDAFEPGISTVNKIKTKVTGNWFDRPTGSGAGVIALSASNHTPFLVDGVNVQNQVDIARSSSRPGTPVTAGGPTDELTFVPLARDAVSVAINTTNSVSTFTEPTLNAIFSCTTLGTGTNVGDVKAGVGGDPIVVTSSGDLQLHPKLPQSASGTLAFFLGAIGISVATEGPCVDTTSTVPGSVTNTLQENHADELQTAGDIAPFSAAQWIAQKNGIAASTFVTPGDTNLKITSITIGGTPQAAVATQLGQLVPGPLFGSSSVVPAGGVGAFNRDVYSVVTTAHITAGDDLANLVTTVLPSQTDTIQDFGFAPVTYTGANIAASRFHSNWTN